MYKNNTKKNEFLKDQGFTPPDIMSFNNIGSMYDPPLNNQLPLGHIMKKTPKTPKSPIKRGPNNHKKFQLDDVPQLMPNYSFAADPIAAAAANVTMVMPEPSQLPSFPSIANVTNSFTSPIAKKKQQRPRKTPVSKAQKAAKAATANAKQTKKNGAATKAKRVRKPKQAKDDSLLTANGSPGRRKKTAGSPKTPRKTNSKKHTSQEDQVAQFLASYGGGPPYNNVGSQSPIKKHNAYVNGTTTTSTEEVNTPTSVFNEINDLELSTALILQSLSQRSFDSFNKKNVFQCDSPSASTSEQRNEVGFSSPNRYVNYYRSDGDVEMGSTKIIYNLIPTQTSSPVQSASSSLTTSINEQNSEHLQHSDLDNGNDNTDYKQEHPHDQESILKFILLDHNYYTGSNIPIETQPVITGNSIVDVDNQSQSIPYRVTSPEKPVKLEKTTGKKYNRNSNTKKNSPKNLKEDSTKYVRNTNISCSSTNAITISGTRMPSTSTIVMQESQQNIHIDHHQTEILPLEMSPYRQSLSPLKQEFKTEPMIVSGVNHNLQEVQLKQIPKQEPGYMTTDQKSPIDYSRNSAATSPTFIMPPTPNMAMNISTPNKLPSSTQIQSQIVSANDTNNNKYSNSEQIHSDSSCYVKASPEDNKCKGVKKRWLRQAASENESVIESGSDSSQQVTSPATPLKKRRVVREDSYETITSSVPSLAPHLPLPLPTSQVIQTPVYNGMVNKRLLNAVEQAILSLEPQTPMPEANETIVKPYSPDSSKQLHYQQNNILEEFVNVACSTSLPQNQPEIAQLSPFKNTDKRMHQKYPVYSSDEHNFAIQSPSVDSNFEKAEMQRNQLQIAKSRSEPVYFEQNFYEMQERDRESVHSREIKQTYIPDNTGQMENVCGLESSAQIIEPESAQISEVLQEEMPLAERLKEEKRAKPSTSKKTKRKGRKDRKTKLSKKTLQDQRRMMRQQRQEEKAKKSPKPKKEATYKPMKLSKKEMMQQEMQLRKFNELKILNDRKKALEEELLEKQKQEEELKLKQMEEERKLTEMEEERKQEDENDKEKEKEKENELAAIEQQQQQQPEKVVTNELPVPIKMEVEETKPYQPEIEEVTIKVENEPQHSITPEVMETTAIIKSEDVPEIQKVEEPKPIDLEVAVKTPEVDMVTDQKEIKIVEPQSTEVKVEVQTEKTPPEQTVKKTEDPEKEKPIISVEPEMKLIVKPEEILKSPPQIQQEEQKPVSIPVALKKMKSKQTSPVKPKLNSTKKTIKKLPKKDKSADGEKSINVDPVVVLQKISNENVEEIQKIIKIQKRKKVITKKKVITTKTVTTENSAKPATNSIDHQKVICIEKPCKVILTQLDKRIIPSDKSTEKVESREKLKVAVTTNSVISENHENSSTDSNVKSTKPTVSKKFLKMPKNPIEIPPVSKEFTKIATPKRAPEKLEVPRKPTEKLEDSAEQKLTEDEKIKKLLGFKEQTNEINIDEKIANDIKHQEEEKLRELKSKEIQKATPISEDENVANENNVMKIDDLEIEPKELKDDRISSETTKVKTVIDETLKLDKMAVDKDWAVTEDSTKLPSDGTCEEKPTNKEPTELVKEPIVKPLNPDTKSVKSNEEGHTSCEEREIKKFKDEFEKYKNPESQPVDHEKKSNGFDDSLVTEAELTKLMDVVEKFHTQQILSLKTKNVKYHKKNEIRRLNLNIDYQFQDDDLRVQIMSPKAEEESTPKFSETNKATYRLTPLPSPTSSNNTNTSVPNCTSSAIRPDPVIPERSDKHHGSLYNGSTMFSHQFRDPIAKRSLSFDEKPRTISTSSTTSSGISRSESLHENLLESHVVTGSNLGINELPVRAQSPSLGSFPLSPQQQPIYPMKSFMMTESTEPLRSDGFSNNPRFLNDVSAGINVPNSVTTRTPTTLKFNSTIYNKHSPKQTDFEPEVHPRPLGTPDHRNSVYPKFPSFLMNVPSVFYYDQNHMSMKPYEDEFAVNGKPSGARLPIPSNIPIGPTSLVNPPNISGVNTIPGISTIGGTELNSSSIISPSIISTPASQSIGGPSPNNSKSPFNFNVQSSISSMRLFGSSPTTPTSAISTPSNLSNLSETPNTEDDRYLKSHYSKIYTRTASSDPRLNPVLNTEPKEKETPAPKKKLSLDQYRKRKFLNASATTTPESTSPQKIEPSSEIATR